jgi:hypothetical protein
VIEGSRSRGPRNGCFYRRVRVWRRLEIAGRQVRKRQKAGTLVLAACRKRSGTCTCRPTHDFMWNGRTSFGRSLRYRIYSFRSLFNPRFGIDFGHFSVKSSVAAFTTWKSESLAVVTCRMQYAGSEDQSGLILYLFGSVWRPTHRRPCGDKGTLVVFKSDIHGILHVRNISTNRLMTFCGTWAGFWMCRKCPPERLEKEPKTAALRFGKKSTKLWNL